MVVEARFFVLFHNLPVFSIRGPASLLLGHRVTVRGGSGSLSLSLGNDIGLMNGTLYNLLLLGVEVLCEVIVQRRLFLLEFYRLSVLAQCYP